MIGVVGLDSSKDKNPDRLALRGGSYIDSREKRLLMHLLSPKPGERVLSIVSGSDDFHLYLKSYGCHATVFELDRRGAGSLSDRAEQLPYCDNEFDIVTLIASLGFTRNPQKVIMEAARVSRGRVFLGVQNRYSLAGTQQRISHLFESMGNGEHLFSIGQLKRMIANALGGKTRIKWGSVIFLPYGWYTFAGPIEENIPVSKNPFGAFLGISFSVTFRYRTIQDPISSFKLGIKRPEIQGTVRG